MSTLGKRIGLLISLGQVLRDITSVKPELFPEYHDQLKEAIKKAKIDNSWFTEDTILESLRVWGDTLTKTKLTNWLRTYDIPESIPEPKKVQVIMAGNIPLVGFHDMISTFISGNIFYGKLSSKDKILLPLILEWMLDFEPGFENLLNLSTGPIPDPDIVIATGSNNTSQIIRQKYGNLPLLVRHNRSSAALINGNESNEDLQNLCKDILSYFGLGCRNVSLIFIPEDYDINKISNQLDKFNIKTTSAYRNAYKYLKAKSVLGGKPFIDNQKVLLFEDLNLNPAIASVCFSRYESKAQIDKILLSYADEIQCVVGDNEFWPDVIPFGESQRPALNDYADGVDTLLFLLNN